MGGEENHQSPELSLEQLVQSLERRDVPLPFEIGSFIVLEACEEQQRRPCELETSGVLLSDAGEVLVARSALPADSKDASLSAVALLRRVLSVAEAEPPPALMELGEKGPAGGWTLDALHDDLEALLVPLNRAAVRRVLARMVRDARRVGGFDSTEIAALSPESAATEPQEDGPERAALPPADELDARFDAWMQRPLPATGKRSVSDAADDEDRQADALFSHSEVDELEEEPPSSVRRLSWLIGLLIVAALLAVWLGLRHGRLFASPAVSSDEAAFVERWDAGIPRDGGLADAETGRERLDAGEADAGPRLGSIRFRSDPSGAQVWLDVGRAPVRISGIPLGVAHELMAVAEGRAPARVVIPAEAEWRSAPEGLRREAVVSLEPAASDASMAMLGPTRLPDELGSPDGRRGTLVVKSRPAGARIFRLMGFTPAARVKGLSTAGPARFLLHHPARGTREVVVEPERWPRDGGAAALELDITAFP